MGSSIFLSSTAVRTSSSTAFASAAATQPQQSAASRSAFTVSAIDPQDHMRLDKYLKALSAPLKMGVDAEHIADGLTGFMALFAGLGSSAQSSLMKNGTYYMAGGEPMNLAADPGSVAGFLDFMQSVQSAANGTSTFVSSSGQATHGVLRMNIFEMNSAAMPNFFPITGTKTLGLDEYA